jgi:hypothetical protein
VPAYYRARIDEFLKDDRDRVLGLLSAGIQDDGFASLLTDAIRAWRKELSFLLDSCRQLVDEAPGASSWGVLLEYPIPRRQKRIDAILLAGDVVLVVEYKIGAGAFLAGDKRQVEDYALDLRDFQSASRDRTIVPVLVATEAPPPRDPEPSSVDDHAQRVWLANSESFATTAMHAYARHHRQTATPIDLVEWDMSLYRPVPTIIEAAEMLFGGHKVADIAHHSAAIRNLKETSACLIDTVRRAHQRSRKAICFVTGVPGAGKTLAGLNVIHDPNLRKERDAGGSFLSGNGPLVRIVSEALIRDQARREGRSRTALCKTVSDFIKNMHVFIQEYHDKRPDVAPSDRVVVFDEAQRAWNEDKERRKFHRDASEPEMMLSIMDRHRDWAVIIALIGGGQEIYDGEAGLAEWGRTIVQHFPHWDVVASPEALSGGSSVAGSRLFEGVDPSAVGVQTVPELHLPIPARTFRAEAVTLWVNAVLDGEPEQAQAVTKKMADFPIVLTRSLEDARRWLRTQTRGNRRCGLVVSSGDRRLRAYGIETSSGFTGGYPWEEWFLAGPTDVRSSFQLEAAATEFQCQGLELDWVGVCWGSDFSWTPSERKWDCRRFVGSRWQAVRKQTDRQYLVNKYRVLLTRAREGMVIWVPTGEGVAELEPARLDGTYRYLRDCGLPELSG